MIYLHTETAKPNDCAFRYFVEGEHHITRRFSQSVLLLGLEGTLFFCRRRKTRLSFAGTMVYSESGPVSDGKQGQPVSGLFLSAF